MAISDDDGLAVVGANELVASADAVGLSAWRPSGAILGDSGRSTQWGRQLETIKAAGNKTSDAWIRIDRPGQYSQHYLGPMDPSILRA
jgi:hypothetical protein